MQLASGLCVFWTAPDRAQIGLDARTGVQLRGLTIDELRLVDSLSLPQTRTDFFHTADELGIDEDRAETISDMLARAGVLSSPTALTSDASAHWRIHRTLPRTRAAASISVGRADALAVEMALILARAGIGTIDCSDHTSVGTNDHPNLQRLGFGQPRSRVFTTALRESSSSIRTLSVGEPTLALATGYHCIDPLASNAFIGRGLPVFHAWVEEYDVVVGPLTIPHVGTCASCMYLRRADATKDWDKLGPQAVSGSSMSVQFDTLALAAALAAREILGFIDSGASMLSQSVWRIGPHSQLPTLTPLAPHPRCGCGAARVEQATLPLPDAPTGPSRTPNR